MPGSSRVMHRVASGSLVAVGFAALCLIPLRAAAPTWTTVGSMSAPRYGGTATPLEDGRVLVAGGKFGSTTLTTAELFDPTTNTWSPAASMAAARFLHAAGALVDGRVLVAGGSDGSTSRNTAEIYNPVANSWSAAASMIRSRSGGCAVVLADGRVLVVGGASYTDNTELRIVFGETGNTDITGIHSDGEVYDPATNTWTLTGATNTARLYGICALLADGRVLVAGGFNGAFLGTAEVYDPDTNAWSSVRPMGFRRASPTSVVLNDGRVFVFGGYDTSALMIHTGGEVYDPVSDSWSLTPWVLEFGGVAPTAALRTDGTVLVVGGLIVPGFPWAPGVSSEFGAVFDPSSYTWSPSSPSPERRFAAMAVPIPGARTLVTGGLNTNRTDVFGAPNNRPAANAGPDQTISGCVSCLGLTTLDGSGSSDPDNDTLVYEWREGTTLLATTTDPVKVVTVGLGLGLHTLTLTVTDGAGGTMFDEVAVEVIDLAANLGTALAQCHADQQALENGIEATLAAIEQNLRVEFKNPSFTIPGGTPQARLQNLGFAITSMNKGQKMAVYRGLGGI